MVISAHADHHKKVLFKEAVMPVLTAKCAGCHGDEKQKGKLRVDTLEAILKGGSEGASVVAGKVEDSPLIQRIVLPADDDDVMPPEGKTQLTKEEIALLQFWVKSGGKGDATIESLKPDAATDKAIAAVLANLPKASAAPAAKPAVAAQTDAQKKAAADAIAAVEKTGASLMPIAQNTHELRFSALNVAKEFGDKQIGSLAAVSDQLKWVDLARTNVTDAGLKQIGNMTHLTRLHLENTGIGDAGLDHLKGLSNLEYLNLYNTKVTDAGIAKLTGLKKLKKVFVWQSKVTDAGAKKLSAAIPGVYVNVGWKAAAAKPVVVAKNEVKKPTPPAPAKPVPAKTDPKKPTPPPTKPAPKKPVPAPAKPAVAAKPAATAAPASLEKALAELKAAAAETRKKADEAKANAAAATKKAEAALKEAEVAKANVGKAEALAKETKAALDQLMKVIELTGKK